MNTTIKRSDMIKINKTITRDIFLKMSSHDQKEEMLTNFDKLTGSLKQRFNYGLDGREINKNKPSLGAMNFKIKNMLAKVKVK